MHNLSTIYQTILNKKSKGEKQLAVLIDPDKYTSQAIIDLVTSKQSQYVDYFFVGGSLIFSDIGKCINLIKDYTSKPVIIFPGHYSHIDEQADAILILSLISGRNPELLIGNHILAAPRLKRLNLETISTGYILIENGGISSVQYISNTQAIPRDKNDIAMATAMAGEMLGMKMIYLEAGSGAIHPVKNEMISEVKANINIPLIVGGGLRTREDISDKFDAGADLLVIGNAIEENPKLLMDLF